MDITEESTENENSEGSALATPKKNPKCIVCGAKAEFCMRGIPKNTYCKDCAESYFGLLEYLDKL
jgi:hypothetical protein